MIMSNKISKTKKRNSTEPLVPEEKDEDRFDFLDLEDEMLKPKKTPRDPSKIPNDNVKDAHQLPNMCKKLML